MSRCYYLCSVWGDHGLVRYPVTEAPQIIGRSDRAQITLSEPTVSRQHASIEVRDDTVILRDLGSKHGTFVNSRRVKETVLKAGDLIVFGLVIVLRLEQTERALAVAPRPAGPPLIPQATVEVDTSTVTTQVDNVESAPQGPFFGQGPPDQRQQQNLSGLGALCLDVLPATYARLTKLLNTLTDLSERQVSRVDLASYKTFLEPVLATLARLLEVATEMSTSECSVIPLAEVVEQAAARVGRDLSRHQILVRSEIPPELKLRADPARLISALGGLLLNAGQSCRDGATIEVLAMEEQGRVVLEITDEGQGHAEEVLFQAFHLTDVELPPVAARFWEARKVILALGGRLTVGTRESRGTVVRIELGATAPPAPGPA